MVKLRRGLLKKQCDIILRLPRWNFTRFQNGARIKLECVSWIQIIEAEGFFLHILATQNWYRDNNFNSFL